MEKFAKGKLILDLLPGLIQMKKLYPFLQRYKYQILLFALLQHLFIGILLGDLLLYTRVIWLICILILGLASIGLFSVTITSIGFGDITPAAHNTKLTTALFGIAGQFYTVVLVGILISKFSSKSDSKSV